MAQEWFVRLLEEREALATRYKDLTAFLGNPVLLVDLSDHYCTFLRMQARTMAEYLAILDCRIELGERGALAEHADPPEHRSASAASE